MTAAFGVASYVSDDGNSYNKRMNNSHFTTSGLSTGEDGLPIYPAHWTARMYHGIDTATKKRHASIICSAAAAEYVGSAHTFSLVEASGTVAFTITGRSGEKRPNLAIPF